MYGVPCVEMSSERRMAGSSPVTSVLKSYSEIGNCRSNDLVV